MSIAPILLLAVLYLTISCQARSSHTLRVYAMLLSKGEGMRYLLLLTLCFVLIVPVSAKGAMRDFGPAEYTASLPAGWVAEQKAAVYVTFRTQDGSCEIGILSIELLLQDPARWAAKRAKIWKSEKTLRALPAGQGFIFQNPEGGRCWLDACDGRLLEISISGTTDALPDLVTGFTPKPEVPGLARIFATLSKSSVALGWLAKGGPLPGTPLPAVSAPVLPDFTSYGATKDKIDPPPDPETAVPAGWTASVQGSWRVILSKDATRWAAYRDYPPGPGDTAIPEGEPQMSTMIEVATLLRGYNFTMSEGVGDFDTPAGFTVIDQRDSDSKCLRVRLYSDETTLNELATYLP
ncbi:hypothetical protein LJC36_00855 [Desulfovibrio sp. OttesenSCG-928-C14]|nr:hypothetical protein [Desulfovibrio sp. OttesenSCG-928-C14]